MLISIGTRVTACKKGEARQFSADTTGEQKDRLRFALNKIREQSARCVTYFAHQ
jgi:hypothetical protein